MSSSSAFVPSLPIPVFTDSGGCRLGRENQAGRRGLLRRKGGVRAFNGQVAFTSPVAMASKGFNLPFSTTLAYDTSASGASRGFGGNWVPVCAPRLIFNGGLVIYERGPLEKLVFVAQGGGVYKATYFVQDHLSYNSGNDEYTLIAPNGTVEKFNGGGQLVSITAPGGRSATVTYDGDLLASVSLVAGSESWEVAFGGGSSSSLARDSEEARIEESTLYVGGHPVRKTAYGYNEDDTLKFIKVYENSAAEGLDPDWGTQTVEATLYTYHASGLLRHVISPTGWRQMVNNGITNPEIANETQVNAYAATEYEYDGSDRVSKLWTNGRRYSFTFDYSSQTPSSESLNVWSDKTEIRFPDGSVVTYYYNQSGEVMLKKVQNTATSPTKIWYPVYQYFEEETGRLLISAGHSALDVDEESDGLATLKSNQGRVEVFAYYAQGSTHEGKLYNTGVKQGGSGGLSKLWQYTYTSPPGWSGLVSVQASESVYRGTGSSNGEVTSYSYLWHGSTPQMSKRTTTLPVIPESENGRNIEVKTEEHFDQEGWLTKYVDGKGVATTYDYDRERGGLIEKIVDQGASKLNLTTNYEVDYLGRTVLELSPVHSIALNGALTSIRRAQWTYYKDREGELWTFRGYRKTSDSSNQILGPVSVQQSNEPPPSGYTGFRQVASFDAVYGSVGIPAKTATFARTSWVRWTLELFDSSDESVEERTYFVIPTSGYGTQSTHYGKKLFVYDSAGRLNQTTCAGGTIDKTIFNVMGWAEQDELGTSSGRAVTETKEYDFDGNLKKRTLPVEGSDTAHDRVTNYDYDFRNRLVQETTTVEKEDGSGEWALIRTYAYDNRDLNLGFKEYHTSVGNTLLRQEAYAYDALGRRYQESVYKVVDGSNAGTTAQISRWYYDALDRVVREALAGSDLYTVTIYDAAGRATTDYWAYGGNSSSSASGSSGSPGPDPTDISQATVVEQIERSFDAADNRVGVAKRQRFDDATGVGALRYATGTQPRARVSYEALYPDAVGRLQAQAFYGTAASGGVAPVPPPPPPAGTLWPWSRPDLIPSGSDTVLVTRINYNSAALVETITFPTGRVDRATYDRMDRLTVLIENDESSSSSSSSSTGYATDTRTTRFAYTDDSWLKSLKSDNAATGQQTTQWDYGAIISETPSTVYSNRHVYQKKYPDTGGGTDLVSYKYNRQREMRWMKDQAGTEHTYLYDKLGRFISDEAGPFGTGINQDVKKLQYGYDRRGRLVRATSFDGSSAKVNEVVWDHNDFNQPITEFQAHGGAVNGSTPKVQYAYATGSANTIRPTGITSPNNTALTIAYNSAMASALSRPDALKEGATTLASFKYLGLETPVSLKYDAAGSAEWTMRNGSATGEAGDVYTGLDRFGRLVETLWKTTTATLVNTTYGRNRFGGVTWQRNDRAHAINPSTDENTRHDNFYWYDRLRQNYQHQRGNLAGTPPNYTGITNLQQTEVRSFDETGNWLSDYTTSPALSQTRTHNKANEIATISGLTAPAFDARGNMTTVPKPGSWTPNCTMAWDAWNRPVSFNDGSATSYKYDALHRRIVKARTTPSETRDYYYDNEWRTIEERVSSTVKAHYAWHPDDRWTLIRRKRSVSGTLDETLFVLKDNLDPAAVINASAAVQERFSYDAFGPVRFLDAAFVPRSGNVSSSDWNFLFHAEFRDVESGLYNYGYRYYHPNLGRWLSRDFIEEEGGLNLYAFVGNETVNEGDLFGLRPPGVNPPRRPSPQRPSPQRPTPQAPAPSPQPSLNPHRNRNRNNHCPAKKPGCGKCQKKGDRVKDRGGNEWDVEGPNPYHPNLDCMRGRNNSTNNPPGQDLRGSQCCFKQDKDCKLENSGKHQGTYDYSPPLRDDGGVSIPGVIGHFLLDVLPHYFDNNYDPTPPENVHHNL